jgi:hypothetical protein
MSLTPEQHFSLIYKAKISVTGKKIAKIEPMQMLHYSNGPSNLDTINFLEEDQIQILMTETDYKKFLNGYDNYLDLMYGMQDPIARDMFEKLMMYLKLKK